MVSSRACKKFTSVSDSDNHPAVNGQSMDQMGTIKAPSFSDNFATLVQSCSCSSLDFGPSWHHLGNAKHLLVHHIRKTVKLSKFPSLGHLGSISALSFFKHFVMLAQSCSCHFLLLGHLGIISGMSKIYVCIRFGQSSSCQWLINGSYRHHHGALLL